MRTQTRHSRSYEHLARWVAAQAGRQELTVEQIAADEELRAKRDELWEEYERLLRDDRSYSLDAIIAWLGGHGCPVSRSSAHRDRRAILSRQHAIALAAERARTILEITARTGTTDLLAGGQALAAQLVFTGLSELDPAILGDLKPNQTVGLIDVLGRLRKSGAETRLIDKRVEELGRKLAEELRRAAATSSDGKLTPDQIDDHIRRKFFGTAA